MPKIEAPTVAEHRALVQARLVDAAEDLLRRGEPLTAAAVTTAAGIARNSVYRYVESVEDLRGLVLARHLPSWMSAVAAELASAEGPAEQVVTWVRANLEQAAATGHGWLMAMARTAPVSASTEDVVDDAHTVMRDGLAAAWSQLVEDPDGAAVAAALTRGLLDAGFRQLDLGRSTELVVSSGERAARALVAALGTTAYPGAP